MSSEFSHWERSTENIRIRNVDFLKSDILIWKELLAVFKRAKEKYGHIDLVFANAGVPEISNTFEDKFDDNGDLAEPVMTVIDVNLKTVVSSKYILGF